MKLKSLFFAAAVLLSAHLLAQVTTIPYILQKGYTGPLTIVFNPNEGNGGMKEATKCYAHTGVSYGGTDWQKTGSWRDGNEKYCMTRDTDGNWRLEMPNGLYAYYGIDESTDVTRLCFVFNDGPNGTLEGKAADGSDIFVYLAEPGLAVQFIRPAASCRVEIGTQMQLMAVASEAAELRLLINDEVIATASSATELTADYTFSVRGDKQLRIEALTDTDSVAQEIAVAVMAPTELRPLPEGIELGINYDPTDDTRVTLCTFAAGCKTANDPSVLEPAKAVYVVGDFTDWQIRSDYQMYRDSCHFWLPIEGLQPRREYAYQYVVVRADGVEKRLSDGFAAKHLHPDDKYEPKTVDPSLKTYPAGADGSYVSILQTAQTPYAWDEATTNFVRPDKNNLIIYELWTYDYTHQRSFAGLMKRLRYLEQLGVNAVELMPIHEFDGNYNWGYSPNHYFAVDKAYGSAKMFRQLVDSIHAHHMAVIVDMVFNHATGLNPQNKLYPYGNDLKYNPWFNAVAPHSDVFYEDWNHDFPETRKMFTRCLNYWLDEYKVDGFRMDLSHGFCGKTKNSVENINYYYDNAIAPHNAYFILEHWGDKMDTERPQLVEKGMLCWNNTNNAYSQLAMGYTSNSNLGGAGQDGYVSYCESHDEERNYYKAYCWGSGSIKTDKEVRLSRVPLTMAFNLLLDGPHMIWQYNELGYDYSIDMNENGYIGDYRTAKKPRPDAMGWFTDSLRMAQYIRVAQLTQLRTRIWPELFKGNPVKQVVSTGWVRHVTWGEGNQAVHVVGNFSPDELKEATLPAGTWYDYFTGEQLQTSTLQLFGGELYVLTSSPVVCPEIDITPFAAFNTGNTEPERRTDIEEVEIEASRRDATSHKYILNGRVVILKNGILYDILGNPIHCDILGNPIH